MRFVEVHEESPCENRERLIYSELAVARESAATPCIQQRLRGRQVAGQLYCGKRGRGFTLEVWVWARRISGSGVIFHGAFRIPRLVLSCVGEWPVIVETVLAIPADGCRGCGWPRCASYADRGFIVRACLDIVSYQVSEASVCVIVLLVRN